MITDESSTCRSTKGGSCGRDWLRGSAVVSSFERHESRLTFGAPAVTCCVPETTKVEYLLDNLGLAHLDELDEAIGTLSAHIDTVIAHGVVGLKRLVSIPGWVVLTAIAVPWWVVAAASGGHG